MSIGIHKIEPGTIVVVNADEFDVNVLEHLRQSLVDAIPHDRWVLIAASGGDVEILANDARLEELVDQLTRTATVNGRAVSEPDA